MYSISRFYKTRDSVGPGQTETPASVAHLDVGPTGDQEVACLTPARSVTFFRGD